MYISIFECMWTTDKCLVMFAMCVCVVCAYVWVCLPKRLWMKSSVEWKMHAIYCILFQFSFVCYAPRATAHTHTHTLHTYLCMHHTLTSMHKYIEQTAGIEIANKKRSLLQSISNCTLIGKTKALQASLVARVALEINVQREWRERVEIVVRLFTVLFLYIFFLIPKQAL